MCNVVFQIWKGLSVNCCSVYFVGQIMLNKYLKNHQLTLCWSNNFTPFLRKYPEIITDFKILLLYLSFYYYNFEPQWEYIHQKLIMKYWKGLVYMTFFRQTQKITLFPVMQLQYNTYSCHSYVDQFILTLILNLVLFIVATTVFNLKLLPFVVRVLHDFRIRFVTAFLLTLG
jgi:hypothetical protein